MDLISTYVDIWIYVPVFKTTYIDRRIPLREGAFPSRVGHISLYRIRGILVTGKGLRITSERYIGVLGVRCLSTLNRGQDSARQSLKAVQECPHTFPSNKDIAP